MLTLRIRDNKQTLALKNVLEMQLEMMNDMLLDELYVPHNKEYITLTKEQMAKLRNDVGERIDEYLEILDIYNRLVDKV